MCVGEYLGSASCRGGWRSPRGGSSAPTLPVNDCYREARRRTASGRTETVTVQRDLTRTARSRPGLGQLSALCRENPLSGPSAVTVDATLSGCRISPGYLQISVARSAELAIRGTSGMPSATTYKTHRAAPRARFILLASCFLWLKSAASPNSAFPCNRQNVPSTRSPSLVPVLDPGGTLSCMPPQPFRGRQ